MKTLIISIWWILLSPFAKAQSAVYVYKNPQKAEGHFMCMRGLTNQREAELLSRQKLEELVNNDKMISLYATTDKKGYGVVIKSEILVQGKKMSIFGAALGCKSYKEAEAKALKNLKEKNPEWSGGNYVIVYKFKD
ncbi:MAG: hypothetical protein OHK0038_18620 [Flammeovirgaceae bacterium]